MKRTVLDKYTCKVPKQAFRLIRIMRALFVSRNFGNCKTVFGNLMHDCLIGAVTMLVISGTLFPAYTVEGENDIWQTKENLTLRLSAEWHKVTVLQHESDAIGEILVELRDLELFPEALTGFSDKSLVSFDKSIETLEKRNRALQKRIDHLKTPLSDAIAILREMVIGEPVESMFRTLEQGNLERITSLLAIKHDFDSLWSAVDTFLLRTLLPMGIKPEKHIRTGGIEYEFFAILKANLGLQSEKHFNRLKKLKDAFKMKADTAQIRQMIKIEQHQITQYLASGNFDLAERKINEIIKRFPNRIDIDEFLMFKAGIEFKKGAYEKVLSLLDKINIDGNKRRQRYLYRIQSLYSLKAYERIIADTTDPVLQTLSGGDRNLALWIIAESAHQLHRKDVVLQFAQQVKKNKPYALHILHTLARSYFSAGDDTTALSILNRALTFKTPTDDDRVAHREITMMIAQLYYERGDYTMALELFYDMINEHDLFERALFGIVWCYLQSNQYEKAETALRKLINQSPEKTWGAEGILILARRYLQNATFAWKKHTYVVKEKQRLGRLLQRLDSLESRSSSPKRSTDLARARTEIKKLLDKVNAEKLSDYTAISSYYDNIEKLCAFISSHYYTGTFQEITFSRKRERILHTIDSVLVELKQVAKKVDSDTLLSNAQKQRRKMKTIVDNAAHFSTISMIDRYRWEREYLDWKKTEIATAHPDSDRITAALKGQQHALRIDSLLLLEDSLHTRYFDILSHRIKNLLATPMDSSDACYLLYQLGELYYRYENSIYARQYEIFDREIERYKSKLEKFRNGELRQMPREPELPQLDHDTSMSYFRQSINRDPTSLFAGAAHYSLAWSFSDLAQSDSAFHHMNMVATHFSNHPHAPQAWMFCGEYHFDKGNLEQALKSFYTVMQYPESEWFDEALYKVAWTQYRLSNPQKAISSFLALVDLGGGKYGQSLLAKESMDYIAISFSETDISGEKGLLRAAGFAKRLGDIRRGCQILHRLGLVYQEQGRLEMAKKTFKLLLSTYPEYDQNPNVEAELLGVLEKDVTTSERSLELKYAYFKKYNHTSQWAKSQPDSIKTRADSIASKMLYDASISYHQFALQNNDNWYYKKAIEMYSAFISYYPTSRPANECHYNLAEIQFSLGNYRRAAEEYMSVSKQYPDSKYRETAAWNAIVASQNLLKQETENGGSR